MKAHYHSGIFAASWLPAHRADIDGLRGVAVILVIAYHAKIAIFRGGYVGVDVFFVISGYLMAQLIRAEMAAGIFRVGAFYERRARRILPAQLCVAIVTLAAATLVLGTRELQRVADSAMSLAAFSSNLFFWTQIDYFDAFARDQPLLHTWSLAVEEQFYLLLAPAAWVALRAPKRIVIAGVAVAASISLAICIAITVDHPSAAFYLLPPRMWEFLGGCALTFLPAASATKPLPAMLALATGAALITLAATGLTSRTPYPGVAALLPCLGSGAILWSGTREGTGRLAPVIGNRALVTIGLMSYSLYLWHWPLFTLMRSRVARELTSVETGAMTLVTLALAYATWRLVELPVRCRARLPSPRSFWTAIIVASALLVLAALTAREFAASPSRALVIGEPIAVAASSVASTTRRCHHGFERTVLPDQLCVFGTGAAGSPLIVLWGDSHANALIPAARQLAETHGVRLMQASFSSCPPLLGVSVARTPAAHSCREFNDMVLHEIDVRGVRRVILAAYWVRYLGATEEPGLSRTVDIYSDPADLDASDSQRNQRNFSAAFERTLNALVGRGIEVWVVRQVPVHSGFNPRFVWHSRGDDQLSESVGAAEEDRSGRESLDRVFDVHRNEAHFLDPSAVLCGRGVCAVSRGITSFYVDDNHLARAGALELEPMLEAAFH